MWDQRAVRLMVYAGCVGGRLTSPWKTWGRREDANDVRMSRLRTYITQSRLTWFIATTALSLSDNLASCSAAVWNAPSVGAKTVIPLLIPCSPNVISIRAKDPGQPEWTGKVHYRCYSRTHLELLEVPEPVQERRERREVGRHRRVLCRRNQILSEGLAQGRRGSEDLSNIITIRSASPSTHCPSSSFKQSTHLVDRHDLYPILPSRTDSTGVEV